MDIKTKIIAFLFGFFLCMTSARAEPFVSVQNIIAGEEAVLQISGFFEGEEVSLRIIRPDGTTLSFEEKADDRGVLRRTYHALHFQKAGMYMVNIVRDFRTLEEEFEVFPGKVSAFRSSLQVHQKSVAADGKEKSFFEVSVRDAFENPIPHVSVQVFSSRNSDKVVAELKTNSHGEISGYMSSPKEGVSVLSALADGVLLFEKPEVVFFLTESPFLSVGADGNMGNFLKAQLFDSVPSGGVNVAYFSFEEVSEELVIGEAFTAKIVAKDANGSIVTGYRGTVRFSSSDDRAELPADYQFTAEDRGEHNFFLAFTFQTPGEQTLAVHSIDDFRIHGELEREIGLGGGAIDVPREASIALLTPRSGTYRSPRVTITGEAVGCGVIKLIDGPTVLTTNLAVDGRGNFLYQTPRLGDGVHIFQAFCAGNESITSNELTVQVDQSPPREVQVTVDPSGDLSPEQPFQVRVTANEPLSGASNVFQGVLTPHMREGESFIADLRAPRECGEFPVDVKASDLLGNEADFPSAGIIRVSGCGTSSEDTFRTSTSPQEGGNMGGEEMKKDTVAPTAVPNVSTESGEGRVTLFWSPADDNEEVKNYKVAFGCRGVGSEEEVTFDQGNVVPDNRTQWYVEGMTDTQECAFQVMAIDESGNIGPAGSEVWGMTLEAEKLLHSSAPKDLEKTGSSSSPMVFVFAVLAGFGVLILSRLRRD